MGAFDTYFLRMFNFMGLSLYLRFVENLYGFTVFACDAYHTLACPLLAAVSAQVAKGQLEIALNVSTDCLY